MKKTKLERAVERLETWAYSNIAGDEDVRTVLAALRAQTPSAVQRAERAVVRAAMAYAAPGIGISGQHQYDRLVDRCNGLQNTKAKAKKARRP